MLHISHSALRSQYFRPGLSPLTALLITTLPKVHSGAEGGPLNFSRHCALLASLITLHTLHFKLHSPLYAPHSTLNSSTLNVPYMPQFAL